MSGSVNYSCAIISGDKKRQLKRDENGYFEHNLGAFNAYNHSGIYYPMLPSIKAMFNTGGTLRRQLDNGQCRGEFDHPKPAANQTLTDFIQRVMTIVPDRVSHHISKVRLEEAKDDKGRPIVLCVGLVKPSGPFGPTLENSLLNPEENTAFSIRSLTDERYTGGRREKLVNSIVTWDYVNEPGLAIANKYQTASMEMLEEDILIPREAMLATRESFRQMGMEDGDITMSRVLTDLGWETTTVVEPDKAWFKW